MFFKDSSPNKLDLIIHKKTTPLKTAKKTYIPPQLNAIRDLDISNNLNGFGDGDAALAAS